jgi:sec-independent protein translocase protein TatB
MIDLGLSKLVIIGVVGLIVLGPERLPKVARIAGTLFGRAQRYMSAVKDEVTREMNASELNELKDLAQSVGNDIQSAEHQARQSWQETHNELNQTYQELSNQTGINALQKPVDASAYQNALAIARARRTGRASWAVKLNRPPVWYRAQQRLPKRVLSEAARMKKHRPHQANARVVKRSFFE